MQLEEEVAMTSRFPSPGQSVRYSGEVGFRFLASALSARLSTLCTISNMTQVLMV